MPLYHGTTQKAWEEIMRTGYLRPAPSYLIREGKSPRMKNIIGIFMTPNFQFARTIALLKAWMFDDQPIILELDQECVEKHGGRYIRNILKNFGEERIFQRAIPAKCIKRAIQIAKKKI